MKACSDLKVTSIAVSNVAMIDCTNKQRTHTVCEHFYCLCELCMTLKDISVPLRRALTLTLQHSQCSAERVERGVGRCDLPGLWQSILWVSTVALTLFSHCLHVSLSTHTNIPYLSACCIMQDHSITQQQHWPSPLFTGISKIAFCDVKAKIVRRCTFFTTSVSHKHLHLCVGS